ncbi:MAG: DUF4398 domain-containing protein [Myxococcota bacterium]
MIDATAEVAAARTAGASETAPYELSTAEVFLAQAREEQGRAQFEHAIELAELSLNCARAAIARSQLEVPEKLVREPVPSPLCRPRRMDVPAEFAASTSTSSVVPALMGPASTSSTSGSMPAPADPEGAADLTDGLLEDVEEDEGGSRP